MKRRDLEKRFYRRFTVDDDGHLPYADANYVIRFAIEQINLALEEAKKAAQPFGGTGIQPAIEALKIHD